MAVNTNGLNVQVDALAGAAGYLSLHSGDPGSSGSHETSAAREQVSWPSASGGSGKVTDVKFTGGAASGACTHVGLWSASSGGTFYGSEALSGDQSFNSQGEYTVTSATIADTSS
jgi:hypothetical protein